jgi:hypothetical protein
MHAEHEICRRLAAEGGDLSEAEWPCLGRCGVKPIDGEEAFVRLKAKTEAQRNRPE